MMPPETNETNKQVLFNTTATLREVSSHIFLHSFEKNLSIAKVPGCSLKSDRMEVFIFIHLFYFYRGLIRNEGSVDFQ